MVGYAIARPVAESMSMEQLSDVQAAHYNLDDNIRRMSGKMTLEQKSKVHDFMLKMMNNQQEG